jgi:hypothetical protein
LDSSWAVFLFLTILVARGLTAGTILGLVMLIPMKAKVGTHAQANYLSELYRGVGPRIYGAATVSMALALGILNCWAFAAHGADAFSYLLLASLGLTGLALFGTSFSLRAMRGLWSAVDREDSASLFIDRFGRWHVYGAGCHTASFITLSLAAPFL